MQNESDSGTLDTGAVLASWTIVLAHLLQVQGLRQALPQFPFPQLLWSFTAVSSWVSGYCPGSGASSGSSDLWRCSVSRWLGVVQVRLRIGMSMLGVCSALFLETLVFLQTLCVYFNKMNPEVRVFLAACHLVKLCLLGSRRDSTLEA